MRDEAVGSKPLEQQAQGARPQRARIQGKDQVCRAAGVSTAVWSKIVCGESLRFSQVVEPPRVAYSMCGEAHGTQSQWWSNPL
jgi:hypothetical protein